MITIAPNVRFGIQHAIWAQLVSGAMNGRALWWEDGYGIYFPALGMPWVQKYTDVEAPVARFVEGVDMTGFKPIAARASGKIFVAALGNGKMIIGWYRDALCEPPDWNVQPVVSKQTVTLTVFGMAPNWQVDFYSTKSGTGIISSTTVTQKVAPLRSPCRILWMTLPSRYTFKNDIGQRIEAEHRSPNNEASNSAQRRLQSTGLPGAQNEETCFSRCGEERVALLSYPAAEPYR